MLDPSGLLSGTLKIQCSTPSYFPLYSHFRKELWLMLTVWVIRCFTVISFLSSGTGKNLLTGSETERSPLSIAISAREVTTTIFVTDAISNSVLSLSTLSSAVLLTSQRISSPRPTRTMMFSTVFSAKSESIYFSRFSKLCIIFFLSGIFITAYGIMHHKGFVWSGQSPRSALIAAWRSCRICITGS